MDGKELAQTRLDICIDREDLHAEGCEQAAQIGGNGRLTDAALGGNEGDNNGHGRNSSATS